MLDCLLTSANIDQQQMHNAHMMYDFGLKARRGKAPDNQFSN